MSSGNLNRSWNSAFSKVVWIFEKPEFWYTTEGQIKAITTQGVVTIQLTLGPLSLDGAQWHHIKHILDDSGTSPLGPGLNMQHELTRQLSWDKDEHTELPAKLLDYFLRSNKSNINQSESIDFMLGRYYEQQKKKDPRGNGTKYHPSSGILGEGTREYGEKGIQPHNRWWKTGQA